jgi:nitric oxide dioxygenase
VKREEHGLISRYLHDQVKIGDSLWISAPAGDFFLNQETNNPIVLISGGVGLTPLLSMLNTLVEKGAKQDIYFIHAAVNGQVHAMDKHLQKLAKAHENVRYYVIYEKPSDEDRMHPHFAKEGFIDQAWLESVIPGKEAEYYFCGPEPFMKTVKNALINLGISSQLLTA